MGARTRPVGRVTWRATILSRWWLRGPKRIRSQQFCAVSNRAAEMVANSSET